MEAAEVVQAQALQSPVKEVMDTVEVVQDQALKSPVKEVMEAAEEVTRTRDQPPMAEVAQAEVPMSPVQAPMSPVQVQAVEVVMEVTSNSCDGTINGIKGFNMKNFKFTIPLIFVNCIDLILEFLFTK